MTDHLPTPPSPPGRPMGQWLVALGLLVLLTLAMFGKVLFTSNAVVLGSGTGDMLNEYLHWRAFGFGELRHGNLALWNPHLFSGAPFFGGAQAALLYPPNVIFLFLPVDNAINWSIALHVFLAGAFTLAWGARRGLRAPSAFLAAVIFMFCGANFLHIYSGYLTFLCGLVWAPLLFLALDGLFEGPALGWSLLGMLALAMQVLAGNPQSVFYTGVAAGIYCGLCGCRAPVRKELVFGLAGIVAGGVALSAVQLFASIQEWREMLRSTGTPYDFAAMFSFPPENLLTLLAPDFFGDMKHVAYWGRCYLWEMSLFIGVSGVVLAGVGAIWGDRRRRRFSLVMAGLLLLLALGAHTPLFHFLFQWVPGFDRFRGNSKFIFLASLFLAMLAGVGFDELLKGRLPSRSLIAVEALAGVLLLGASVAVRPVGFNATTAGWWHVILLAVRHTGETYLLPKVYDNPTFILLAGRFAARSLLVGGGVLALVALLLYGIRRCRPVVWLLLGLAVVELFVFGRRSLDSFELSQATNSQEKEYLEQHPGDYRILNQDIPDSALSLGSQDIWGYEPGIVDRYAQFMAFIQGINPDQAVRLTSQSPGVLPQNPMFGMLRCRFEFIQENNHLTIFEHTNCLPHVFLVQKYRVLEQRAKIFGALTNAFRPGEEVILETEPSPRPMPPTNAVAGQVRLVGSATDWLDIEADTPAPAILVVADTYAQGWRARGLAGSGQNNYSVMPADWCLRAVPLAAGHHRLRLEYAPSGFRTGKWVSLISLAIFLSLAGVKLRQLAGGAIRRARASVCTGWADLWDDIFSGGGDAARGFKLTADGRIRLAVLVGLLAVTLFAYWQVLGCDFVNYDDPVYVTENGHVQQGLTWDSLRWAFTNLDAGFWHPLTWLSLLLDMTLFGNAAGFHLTSLLLHLGSTAILFLALRRMTGALWRSAAVAALFALHPLHVESVAWIAERKDALSTLFWMVTLLFYARYAQAETAGRNSLTVNYCLALFFFACGLMSKTMLVTLPAVLLLLDFWPLKRVADFRLRMANWGGLVLEKTPFFVLAFLAGLGTLHSEAHVGALPTTSLLAFSTRAENATLACLRYLGEMIWPAGLAVFYPYPKHFSLWPVAGAGLLLAGFTVFALRRWRTRPYLAVGWLWYVGTWLPVSGLIQVGSHAAADRYTYVPLIGVFIILIWGLGELAARWRLAVTELTVAAVLGFGACTALTVHQLGFWQNSETLFRHALAVTSNNHIANNDLGTYLHQRGRMEEAIPYYQEAIRIDPGYADALNNYGYALASERQYTNAMLCYDTALQVDPAHVPARYNLGLALGDLGRYEEAAGQFEQVLKYSPGNVSVRYHLGNVLAKLGRQNEAIEQYRLVSQLTPDNADDLNNLGYFLESNGQLDEAISDYRQALQFNPYHVDALNNLGNALFEQKKYAEAIPWFQAALQVNPYYVMARYNWGNALFNSGRMEEAATQYAAAVNLNTNYAEAHYQLGVVLIGRHQTAAGIAQLREALRVKPDWYEPLDNLAWELATGSDARLRNGKEAATLATRAVQMTGRKNSNALDTLAAAQAETGDYAAAIRTEEEAIRAAGPAESPGAGADLRIHLQLYQAGRPCREPEAPAPEPSK